MDDYEKYEAECKTIREDNALLLRDFEAWLKSSGLSKKVIDSHLCNIDFFINEYLLYEEATEAKDGVDATNLLQDRVPDLMLLDIEMPRMDGFEVASYVKNDERLKDVPIVMITSRTGSKHKEKAMEIGVDRYLGKPFQEDDLMRNINEILDTSFSLK